MNDPIVRAYLTYGNRESISDYCNRIERDKQEWHRARFIPLVVSIIVLGLLIFVALSCVNQDVARAEMTLSTHFKKSELACHHCKECKVNIELIIALEKLRQKVNRPIIITSGYRCPLHNQSVGGARNSQHKFGNAVDIKIKGYSPAQVARLAKQCGFTWTKVYSGWTHIDVRRTQLARGK